MREQETQLVNINILSSALLIQKSSFYLHNYDTNANNNMQTFIIVCYEQTIPNWLQEAMYFLIWYIKKYIALHGKIQTVLITRTGKYKSFWVEFKEGRVSVTSMKLFDVSPLCMSFIVKQDIWCCWQFNPSPLSLGPCHVQVAPPNKHFWHRVLQACGPCLLWQLLTKSPSSIDCSLLWCKLKSFTASQQWRYGCCSQKQFCLF